MRAPEVGLPDVSLATGLADGEVVGLVGWAARVHRMVEVEAALAHAQADVGLLPPEVADAVVAACDPSRLDLDALAAASATAASPVIPLLRALTEGAAPAVGSWLHHGATSQDVLDTATVLQVRDALEVLEAHLHGAATRCATLAAAHADTVLPGRTLGQQAVPVTFGLVAARWLGALQRRLEQLRWVRRRVLVVQLGGAAGTGAVWGSETSRLVTAFAGRLGLDAPVLPWHAERDRVAELAGALAAASSTIGGVASQLVLRAQTELGEVREHPGPGPGSSAMPHKANPVHATAARAAARVARGEAWTLVEAAAEHEFERAAGAWQAEWVALPSLLAHTAGAARRLVLALDAVDVDASRSRANLDVGHHVSASEALVTHLAPHLGRGPAGDLAGELARTAAAGDRSLVDLAAADPRVTEHLGDEVRDLLSPERVVALVSGAIDRALADWQAAQPPPGP